MHYSIGMLNFVTSRPSACQKTQSRGGWEVRDLSSSFRRFSILFCMLYTPPPPFLPNLRIYSQRIQFYSQRIQLLNFVASRPSVYISTTKFTFASRRVWNVSYFHFVFCMFYTPLPLPFSLSYHEAPLLIFQNSDSWRPLEFAYCVYFEEANEAFMYPPVVKRLWPVGAVWNINKWENIGESVTFKKSPCRDKSWTERRRHTAVIAQKRKGDVPP